MLSRSRDLTGFFLHFLPALFLITIYFFLFGLESVERFLEESIVVNKKSLAISSSGLEVNPGARIFFIIHLIKCKENLSGLAIIPTDPLTGIGWKSTNASHLSNVTTAKLKKGLEDQAYKYEDIGR